MFSNPKERLQVEISFPDVSYPSLRDGGNKTGEEWILGKIMDDGAEGLWRIHDQLYDFSSFAKLHPGGESWLTMTKGTDITEVFETHHFSDKPQKMLVSFLKGSASTKRHSPFTFEDEGFYKVLKARSRDIIRSLPPNLARSSKIVLDCLALVMFVTSVSTCWITCMKIKTLLIILAGLFMTWTTVCSHNFTHQKDNWRMYLINFTFSNVREWRIMHILSHHMFPNTLMDAEISFVEPFIVYLPRSGKNLLERYGPRLYYLIFSALVYDSYLFKKIKRVYDRGDVTPLGWDDFLPLSLPMAMYFLSRSTFGEVLVLWVLIWHVGSTFGNIIGQNAAHHHPDIFHDGDAPMQDRDWGLHQLHAVTDRVEVNRSIFLVLTNYGEHGLHHLFPVLDHAHLPHLRSVFIETCNDFGTELRTKTQLDLMIGHFRQISRVERKT